MNEQSIWSYGATYVVLAMAAGCAAAACSSRPRRSWLLAIRAGLVLGALVVAALEWDARRPAGGTDPLTGEDRAIFMTITLAGALLGAVPVAYARWVRRVFRRAEGRLRRTAPAD
jgi:hypothetical protein